MNEFFEKNHKLVYQEWIDPSELKNASVLDLGSGTGWLGEYCISHGASKYVGVDIDHFLIEQSKKQYPNLMFYVEDVEMFVKNAIDKKEKFDIVVISRTLQGILNQITFLRNVSKITDHIVLEVGVPVNIGAYKLLNILQNIQLTNDQKDQLETAINFIEYEQEFVEYVVDNRFLQPIPSIGLYKKIADKIGFNILLDTYESVKNKYPEEYGYKFKNKEWDLINKAIIKLKKIKNTDQPLTWKEWYTNTQ